MLMLAWKVAGYISLDYYLLAFLGGPWRNEEHTGGTPTLAGSHA